MERIEIGSTLKNCVEFEKRAAAAGMEISVESQRERILFCFLFLNKRGIH